MKMELQLNNGMLIQVVPHCRDNANIAKYRIIYRNKEVARSQCAARVLPSQLKKFFTQKINSIWESDAILINDFLRSMYSENTGKCDIRKVKPTEVLMVATPSYSEVRAPHTKGGRR